MLVNKLLLSIGACFLAFTVNAQAPAWMDKGTRSTLYPRSAYLTGYAELEVAPNESRDAVMERAKSMAQIDLIESIKLTLKSSTTSTLNTTMLGGQYTEDETLSSISSKSAQAEITGMRVETYWQTVKKQTFVYAFAYAKKQDVVNYYRNVLATGVSYTDNLLETAELLSSADKRENARTKLQEADKQLKEVLNAQVVLQALAPVDGVSQTQLAQIANIEKQLSVLNEQLDVRYDILKELQNTLNQQLSATEALLQTSKDLIAAGEKSQGRKQCALAKQKLSEVAVTQRQINNVKPTVSAMELQTERVDALNNEVSLLSASLEQAVMIYIDSQEDVLGKSVQVLTNKLKSQMASLGCSFTNDIDQADFKLTLNATTRESSQINNMFFCFADVSLQLDDLHKHKNVYSNDYSKKAGSSSAEKAARRALEMLSSEIIDNLSNWIK